MPTIEALYQHVLRTRPERSVAAACSITLSCLAMFAFPMPSHATEEPDFKIIRELDTDIAIRDYAAYVVAEVVVPGPAEKAGNQAFPILAGYIFGKR